MTGGIPTEALLRWRLRSGECLTVAEIHEDPRNVCGVSRHTIRSRLTRGVDTWEALMRPADRSRASRENGRKSPWSRGPHCKTPNARREWRWAPRAAPS